MVRDELFFHVVREGSGRLLAVAPMMLTRRPSMGPVKARVLQCFGADVNVTEIRGLICRPEDQGAALSALMGHFARCAGDWDWIDWGSVRDDGSGHDELAGAGVIGGQRQTPNYYLPLAPTWSEFRGRLSRNIKESLRKCYNSLRRDNHRFTLRVVESPAETASALQIFFRLHRERARSNSRVKHMDVFTKPKDRDFLTEYAQRMAERKQLRIFQLEIGGRVVATRVGFQLGDELYLYYSGYEMAWARYSVMTTLVAEAIKWAIDRRLRIVSLSTGKDVSKLRWGPRAVVFRSALQVAPGWQSALAFRAYHQMLQARDEDSALGKLLTLARR
jgi:CelD/BcsL family acetyltransferase involved in cellulose biosynthesis